MPTLSHFIPSINLKMPFQNNGHIFKLLILLWTHFRIGNFDSCSSSDQNKLLSNLWIFGALNMKSLILNLVLWSWITLDVIRLIGQMCLSIRGLLICSSINMIGLYEATTNDRSGEGTTLPLARPSISSRSLPTICVSSCSHSITP